MKIKKNQILKKLNSKKTTAYDKNMLSLYYLEESKNNEKVLAKLSKKNQKEKAIKKFGEKGLHFEDLGIYYAIQNYNIFHYYNLFTGDKIKLTSKQRTKDLQKLVKNEIIKSFEVTDKNIVIEQQNGQRLNVAILSATLLKDEKFDEVKTCLRVGNCHLSVRELCWELPFKHTIVTGYVCLGREQEKTLHTWIEFNHNGKEKVIDYTMNAIMDKIDYYLLRHVQNIVSEIKNNEIKNNFTQESFKQLTSYFDMKFVLCNWNKFLDELKRNNLINEK